MQKVAAEQTQNPLLSYLTHPSRASVVSLGSGSEVTMTIDRGAVQR